LPRNPAEASPPRRLPAPPSNPPISDAAEFIFGKLAADKPELFPSEGFVIFNAMFLPFA
jgi:hypothetical protein